MLSLGALKGLCPEQHCPRHCPPLQGLSEGPKSTARSSAKNASLGRPVSLKQAAELIGCSPWTVRQRLIPLGLPYVRFAASGKLIFYTNQIAAWILKLQGGNMT